LGVNILSVTIQYISSVIIKSKTKIMLRREVEVFDRKLTSILTYIEVINNSYPQGLFLLNE